jgi:cation transporter-like permease
LTKARPSTSGHEGSGAIISDRLGNNVIKLLVVLPLVTATIGWAGAAATARIRPRLAAGVVPVPVMAVAPAGEPGRDPMTAPPEAGRAVRVRSWRRIAYLLLLCAVLAVAVFLAVISGVSGR